MFTMEIINHERVFISPLSKFQTCLIPLGFVFHGLKCSTLRVRVLSNLKSKIRNGKTKVFHQNQTMPREPMQKYVHRQSNKYSKHISN